MIKCFVFMFLCFQTDSTEIKNGNDDIYLYDNPDDDYASLSNETQDYDDIFEGRNEHNIVDARPPPYQLHHYPTGLGHIEDLTSLLNYHRNKLALPGLNKKRKIFRKKQYHYITPLLLTALAKIAHFLPVVKLTLLALFALVLFSKKALLVSLGSLILVIYDTFIKGKKNIGVNIVKDRASTVPTIEQGVHHTDEHHVETPEVTWWEREEPTKLNPREGIGKGDKWKRWWAPQINYRQHSRSNPAFIPDKLNDGNLLMENLQDIIYQI